MTAQDVIMELSIRMEKAARDLNTLAGTAGNPEEQDRLFGKEEGVRLALSYVKEFDRFLIEEGQDE